MRALFLLVLSTAVCVSHASEQEALEKLNHILASPELTAAAYAAGEERIILCGYCHGRDGNSTRTHIPNLAEQNPVYLFTAFEKFASGERSDYVMEQAAAILDLDERVNIALYYGKQKVKAKATVNPELDSHGKTRFEQLCIACHGSNGEGHDEMPRLAGQPADFVRQSLLKFRAGGEHRPGSPMISVAQQLNDKDIEALASYIQGLNI